MTGSPEIKQSGETAHPSSDENFKKLDSCKKPHSFQTPNHGITGFPVTWTCSMCGGTVSDEGRKWYVQGLTHGRRETNPDYPDLPASDRREPQQHARARDTQTSGLSDPISHL